MYYRSSIRIHICFVLFLFFWSTRHGSTGSGVSCAVRAPRTCGFRELGGLLHDGASPKTAAAAPSHLQRADSGGVVGVVAVVVVVVVAAGGVVAVVVVVVVVVDGSWWRS